MDLEIRVMTGAEVSQTVDWAAREGWNPGLSDVGAFRSVDAEGFVGAFIDEELVASISVINYDPRFAFLGFYIVRPDLRGQGIGLRLWTAALNHAGDRVVGLDGVIAEQENYRRSGFDLAWRNIRFGGVPTPLPKPPHVVTERINRPVSSVMILDSAVFPATRFDFWAEWLSAETHVSVQARIDDVVQGFGTLRRCRNGYKIGPLTARSVDAAQAVMADLLAVAEPGAEIFFDVPEPNTQAVQMAETMGLVPVFETARMYRGDAPDIALDQIFGVTSFELG